MSDGIQEVEYFDAGADRWQATTGYVIDESSLTLYINGIEWVTLMCTPVNQDELVLGFLSGEGVIHDLEDVVLLDIAHGGKAADIWIAHDVTLPRHRVITSGCVGGVTFTDSSTMLQRQSAGVQVTPAQLISLMDQLGGAAVLYPQSRGVHTSALSDGEHLLVVREDVGRHNTVDKLLGACLMQGIDTKNRILLTTGRISSEMLRKAAGMQSPVVVSRTSPTSMSLKLAQEWNMTIAGYVRSHGLRIYVDPARRVCFPLTIPATVGAPAPEVWHTAKQLLEKNAEGQRGRNHSCEHLNLS